MFYSVKFNRFNGYRSSRSELQISMDVRCRFPLFEVSLKFKSRDFRCVLVMINAARFIETSCFGVHPYLWHLQRGTLLGHPWANVKNEKCFYALNHHLSNSAMRILINSYQFYVLKGVSSGVSSAQATHPWIWWTCWTDASWLRWASSTAVAASGPRMSTSTDIPSGNLT